MTRASATILLLAPLAAAPRQEPPGPAQVEWLREHAVPLATVRAGNGFEDLEPLRAMIGDARVVGLGESTHGSREQFQLKHRLLEFLVEELGFDVFSIEASMPESYRVDDFVSRGEDDPVQLIRGMYFWTWSTEEVLEMVEWMRAFNVREKDERVRFTGFDMQTPDVAFRIVVDELGKVDTEYARELERRYGEIVDVRPETPSWTSATGALEPASVAGTEIVFSGQVRSDGVDYAALWFRADRGEASVAFMNTKAQHRVGEAWTEHEIRLSIPADADAVVFGLIHSGAGTCWFDELRLTVDGEELLPEGFDFPMEVDGRGFHVVSRDYRGGLDREVAAGGAASYRIERVTPLVAPPEIPPARAAQIALEIVDELRARADELSAALGEREAAWTIQMARVVAQCLEARVGGGAARDRAMAENVMWILEDDPEAKLVLWAHNAHVANDGAWMGAHLERVLGDDYVPIGFATSRGEYRALSADRRSGLANHALAPAPAGSVESFFEAAELELALLDLRLSVEEDPRSGWLRESRPMRSIGALQMERQFFPATAYPSFELLLYTADTTGARPLRSAWAEAPADDE